MRTTIAMRKSLFSTLPAVLLLLLCGAAMADEPVTDATRRPMPTAGAYSWTVGPFAYDPSGNVATIGGNYYLYDPMGRLVTASVQRPDQPGSQVQTFGYDTYGNRTTVNGVAAYAANTATNQLTTVGAVYDPAGNLTQWQPPGSAYVRQYTYDSLNMITNEVSGGQEVVNLYTADDERVWRYEVTNNVSHWTLRDLGGKVLREFVENPAGDPDWKLSREYIYRDGQLLAVNTPAGTEHYSLDHLGSPRLITHGNRNLLFLHHYLPFGGEWTAPNDPVDESTLRFTSHERDDDPHGQPNGTLDYMHARYYSGNLGRFASVDPVLDANTALSSPQAWNRYAYGRNQPIVYIDPDGRLAIPWHFGITYVAARRNGMSFGRSISLAVRAAAVDLRKGSQSPLARDTNTHAMRGRKPDGKLQTIAEGRAGTVASIRNSLGTDLAAALHTTQDAATPLHQDRVWPGSYANLGLRDATAHFLSDLFPTWSTITAATAASEGILAGDPIEALPLFSSNPLPPPGLYNDQTTTIFGFALPGEGALIDGVWYFALSTR